MGPPLISFGSSPPGLRSLAAATALRSVSSAPHAASLLSMTAGTFRTQSFESTGATCAWSGASSIASWSRVSAGSGTAVGGGGAWDGQHRRSGSGQVSVGGGVQLQGLLPPQYRGVDRAGGPMVLQARAPGSAQHAQRAQSGAQLAPLLDGFWGSEGAAGQMAAGRPAGGIAGASGGDSASGGGDGGMGRVHLPRRVTSSSPLSDYASVASSTDSWQQLVDRDLLEEQPVRLMADECGVCPGGLAVA